MRASAEEHATDQVGSRDTGRALDNFEASGGFDEAVAVFAAAIGGDVVAVDYVFAAVMGDPREGGYVWCVGYGLGYPSAGVDGCDSIAGNESVTGYYVSSESLRWLWKIEWWHSTSPLKS